MKTKARSAWPLPCEIPRCGRPGLPPTPRVPWRLCAAHLEDRLPRKRR